MHRLRSHWPSRHRISLYQFSLLTLTDVSTAGSTAQLCSAVLGCARLCSAVQLLDWSSFAWLLGCSAAQLLSMPPPSSPPHVSPPLSLPLSSPPRSPPRSSATLGGGIHRSFYCFTPHARKLTALNGHSTCMHNCYGLCLCVVECTVYVAMHGAACIERCFSTPHFHPNDPIILPARVC